MRLKDPGVRREDGVTVVDVAALDRSSGGDVSGELEAVTASLQTALGTGTSGEGTPGADQTNAPARPGTKDLEDKS